MKNSPMNQGVTQDKLMLGSLLEGLARSVVDSAGAFNWKDMLDQIRTGQKAISCKMKYGQWGCHLWTNPFPSGI